MKPDIILVDAPHLLYRSVFAYPEMSYERDGEEHRVGGIWGFLNTIKQTYERHGGLVICAWEDRKRSIRSYRRSLYGDYKIKNKDEEIDYGLIELRNFTRQQEDELQPLLSSIGIPQVWSAGYEADDCIAVLCKVFKASKKILILTSDKDLFALIDENVAILRPKNDEKSKEYYEVVDLEKWKTGYGKYKKGHKIEPYQWSLALALMGDTSDNVPGIDKVGPVNAEKLINQYGNMKEIFKAAENNEINRFSKSICNMKKQLEINEKLTKLYDNIELQFVMVERDKKLVRNKFVEMRFNKLLIGCNFNIIMEMGVAQQ